MKKRFNISFLTLGLGTLVFLGFAGTISGSLAWWAYSTRVAVGFHGTSIASSEQLQIGLKTSVDMSSYGMSKPDEDSDYYFCEPGIGLQAEAIAYYLTHYEDANHNKYAIDKLEPVTSGSYTIGNDLSLKNPLVAFNPFNEHAADTNKYVKLPLAFRILKYDANNQLVPSKGENVWLSHANAQATSAEEDGLVYKALRMHTKGKYVVENEGVKSLQDVKTIINPSDTRTGTHTTDVAGLLDLSGSGFYDTYEKNGKSYAIIYGETTYETETDLLACETEQQTTAPSENDWVDFNGTGNRTSKSTFTSRYFKDTWHPDDKDAINAKTQQYDTLTDVKPTDFDGVLSGGKPLCATDLTTGIADLELTIWLEGWDHNVIDEENTHSFNLDLQFQISRL